MADLRFSADTVPDSNVQDCRNAPGIALPFLATVRGVDRTGARFKIDTVLDNLSTHSLAMQLTLRVELGTRLFVVVRFATEPAREETVPGVAARGVVQQVKPRPDGAYDVVVTFRNHRFLYARVIHQ